MCTGFDALPDCCVTTWIYYRDGHHIFSIIFIWMTMRGDTASQLVRSTAQKLACHQTIKGSLQSDGSFNLLKYCCDRFSLKMVSGSFFPAEQSAPFCLRNDHLHKYPPKRHNDFNKSRLGFNYGVWPLISLFRT